MSNTPKTVITKTQMISMIACTLLLILYVTPGYLVFIEKTIWTVDITMETYGRTLSGQWASFRLGMHPPVFFPHFPWLAVAKQG